MINEGHLPAGSRNDHAMQKLAWQRVNLRLETQNAFENYNIIRDNIGDKIRDLAELPRNLNRPLLICGSGSSIDPIMPEIKQWPHDIMSTTSQAATLIHHGVWADYALALDPRVSDTSDEIAAPDWGKTKLLIHPSIPTPYLERWLARGREPAYLFRILEPSYDWYSHHIPWAFSDQDDSPWARVGMLPFLDSSAAMITLAARFGYSPVFFAGVDYGGPRFTRHDYDMDSCEWSINSESGYDAAHDKSDRGGMTAQEVQTYSSRGSMLAVYKALTESPQKTRWYQLNRDSLFRLPAREWSRVLDNAERESEAFPRAAVLKEIEINLAQFGTYPVVVQMGGFSDLRIFVAESTASLQGMLAATNRELSKNIEAFGEQERAYGRPLMSLIQSGQITIEAGALLLRLEELEHWDWRAMEFIDVEAELYKAMQRRRSAERRDRTAENRRPV
jgi:hypothetical protein